MNNLFVEFLNRLENLSGDKNLCEAILQGYLACHPIFEDAEGRAASKTRDFIRTRIGEDRSNDIARDQNGEPILTAKGNEQTTLDYFERQIRDMFFHNDYANIKFEPGVARIAFDDLDFHGRNHDVRRIETLKGILKIISSAHKDEYDANLNGMSFNELSERFGESMVAASNEDYERVKSGVYTKNDDYSIIEIHSFEESEEYCEYTNPNSPWCLTYMEDMWDTYTAKGVNRVYFVLKDGFEDMDPKKGENCPLDEYGLSMICVIVTNDMADDTRPMLCTCTCRWNHDNGGSDQVMNVEQISNVIGQPFYDAFKPFSLEELHAKGIYTFKEKLEKYNETHDRSLFDYVGCFIDGYAEVELNGKYNWIDKDGNLLWKGEKWFDWFDDFEEGYANVELNGKWTFIDKDGNLLWKGEKWFDRAGSFHEGYAAVERNEKGWNFIDKDGNLLWKGEKWFDKVYDFREGYGTVVLNGKKNRIGKDGNLLWKGEKWFDCVGDFEEGYAAVRLNGKYNFIGKDGNLLWKGEEWFDYVYLFKKGYAEVTLKGKYNWIDTDGNLLWKGEEWFDYVGGFKEGYAIVKLNRKCNWIDKDGNLLWKGEKWFDDVEKFKEGYARVELDGKYNWIDKSGNLLWKGEKWFDYAGDFDEGYAGVIINGKWNRIDKKGNLRH